MKLKMNEVSFMGHLLTNKGLKPYPGEVEEITKMPKPHDAEGGQHFDEFVNYLSSLFQPCVKS